MTTAAADGGGAASPERAEQILQRADWALGAYAGFQRAQVLRIAEAAAEAGAAKAEAYAKWAVEETGFGVVEHKVLKNRFASRGIFDHYRDQDFTGYRIDRQRQIIEVARPAGVVFALTPSTNPVASVFFKIMLALLTRNAIVLSPHPAAKACCSDAARTLAEAAERAGAPDGIIQVIEEPDLTLVGQLMGSPRTAVILATGGSPMVRAAYSSGNPALGVGPGNCPAYVDASADVAAAAKHIAYSKAFDNSVLCTSESAVIAHSEIAARLRQELERQGCYFCSESERDGLEAGLFPEGRFNLALLGRSAGTIAQHCGLSVPQKTRILVVPLARIGDDYPLSGEKLCPVLGFYEVASAEAGLGACRAMVRRQGAGHSAALHGQDPQVILRFGARLNVLRVVINAPCSTGVAGFETNLTPTMTVGTGFFGRSSIAENVGPQHLIQWTRVAFHKDEAVDLARYEGLSLEAEHRAPAPPVPTGPTGPAGSADLRDEIRQIILEELRNLTAEMA